MPKTPAARRGESFVYLRTNRVEAIASPRRAHRGRTTPRIAGTGRGRLSHVHNPRYSHRTSRHSGAAMISQKAKYALRALVALAKQAPETSLMISEIAREQAIPKKFLEQILLELKRDGVVMSRRGRLGGYVLLAPSRQDHLRRCPSADRRAHRAAAMPLQDRLSPLRRLRRRGKLRNSPCLPARRRGHARGAGPHDAGRCRHIRATLRTSPNENEFARMGRVLSLRAEKTGKSPVSGKVFPQMAESGEGAILEIRDLTGRVTAVS